MVRRRSLIYFWETMRRDKSTVATVLYIDSAQSAGDLTVLLIAWGGSTRSVHAVTETSGNTYVAAGGPTRGSGVAAQQMYYSWQVNRAR